MPAISASGTSNALLFSTTSPVSGVSSTNALRIYDQSYTSLRVLTLADAVSKFSSPTVVNGKVREGRSRVGSRVTFSTFKCTFSTFLYICEGDDKNWMLIEVLLPCLTTPIHSPHPPPPSI